MTTFATPAPIALDIDVLCGNVTVIASDRADTVVEVRAADASKKADVRAAEQTVVELSDGTLSVRMPKNWRTYTPFGGNASIAVTVHVPTGSRLKATAGVGKIHGVGELGECALDLALGDIVVDRPLGSVTAKVAKGDIRIGEATRGVLRLQTSMGELEIGIRPGSAVRTETATQKGSVRNDMQVVAPSGTQDVVQVFARNSLGNIVIRHTAAA
ncbi:hypothetical protein GPX89_17845 [Nocardia sp. ET3-3]|uniref:DUF4097 domain-containing protein n=1 Tax=Nocardia terrae TaxID=2675851 RepID=A0A7K1UXV2_9NOCA|nr:DUF4097 family beta strand repeat-containing protein [Nocardia terrae]MVU79101.1 hypothetical protein [Nocardia terrae]